MQSVLNFWRGGGPLNSVILEQEGRLDAHGRVSEERAFRDDLLVFDLNGKIRMARSCEGKHRAGDSIRAHMTAAEWEYLRKNCLSYECARILVNTREGAMLVFCNMLASMHIMIGVILHADREAVAYYCQRHITMVDRVSPCLAVPRRVTPPSDEQLSQIDELLSLSFSAFATAGVRNELGRSILGATSYIIRRICFLARMVGCCVNCRSVREFAPRVEDFNGDAFVAMMLHLFFFVYDRCASRTAEIEIADFDARPRIVLRCELPEGEGEIFVNRRFRYAELDYCDSLSAERAFPFECAPYAMGMKQGLRIAFCPKIRYVDGLHVKEPLKKLNYSDFEE